MRERYNLNPLAVTLIVGITVNTVNFYVKTKNAAGKTIGFQRTLIPLNKEADGSKNFAVVENIQL